MTVQAAAVSVVYRETENVDVYCELGIFLDIKS